MRVYVPGFAGSEGMIARRLFCGTHTHARGAVCGGGESNVPSAMLLLLMVMFFYHRAEGRVGPSGMHYSCGRFVVKVRRNPGPCGTLH